MTFKINKEMQTTIQTQKKSIRWSSLAVLLMGCMFIFGAQEIQAQAKKDKVDKKEKIKELRKKYFNEKLALSDAEQKAFWPLYDEYKQKEKALRDSFKSKYKPNDVIFMDDKKAEEFLNATIKLNDDQNNLFKEYILKFKKVLPVKKVAMLPMVEREFKKELLDKAGKGPGGKRPGGPGGPGGPPDGPGPDDE
jgi:hypothetical protein